jgi:hypothetical protein
VLIILLKFKFHIFLNLIFVYGEECWSLEDSP